MVERFKGRAVAEEGEAGGDILGSCEEPRQGCQGEVLGESQIRTFSGCEIVERLIEGPMDIAVVCPFLIVRRCKCPTTFTTEDQEGVRGYM